MAKSVTLKEFTKFYTERLQARSESPGVDTTREFKYIDIGIDSRTNEVWRIILDMKHPKKELEINTTMDFEGTILELLEQKLDERRQSRNSGAI